MKKMLACAAMLLAFVLPAGCAATDTPAPAATSESSSVADLFTPLPSPTKAVKAWKSISPGDAKALIGTDDVTLLDVREQEEYDEGHIDGAVLLPYDTITADSEALPEDKASTVIVYCRSGRRSAIAAETLAGLGYTNVYDLGGIQSWPYETVK